MNFISRKICAIALFVFLSGCFIQNKSEPKVEFVSKQGIVNPMIVKLLNLTGVLYTDGTVASVVDETQKHWLRKPGSERWDISTDSDLPREKIYKICEQLDMFSEVKPEHKEYEYVFVLGALFGTMKFRLTYLVDLWNKGIRFKTIVFLAGSRALNTAQGETQEVLEQWTNTKIENMPKTEIELLQFIYDHISMPDQMRRIPVQIVNVPMLQNSDGTFRRPTTGDTVEWWLKDNPKPGKILAVSNQPYVWYQNSVLKTLLPATFEVDTVGQACSQDQKIGLLLDTLARILYQEKMRLEK